MCESSYQFESKRNNFRLCNWKKKTKKAQQANTEIENREVNHTSCRNSSQLWPLNRKSFWFWAQNWLIKRSKYLHQNCRERRGEEISTDKSWVVDPWSIFGSDSDLAFLILFDSCRERCSWIVFWYFHKSCDMEWSPHGPQPCSASFFFLGDVLM